jgi:hypothetical protein
MGLKFLITILLLLIQFHLFGQKFISKNSSVTFFSKAPLENIEAINTKSTSIYDLSTGEIVFSIPIREFQFQKSLMKTHFNENYMESDKYPNATFKGKVSGFSGEAGTFSPRATGALTIHGKTQNVEVHGEIQKNGDHMVLKATFPVSLKDYNVKIPRLLFSNIAESVEVNIEFTYKPYVSN